MTLRLWNDQCDGLLVNLGRETEYPGENGGERVRSDWQSSIVAIDSAPGYCQLGEPGEPEIRRVSSSGGVVTSAAGPVQPRTATTGSASVLEPEAERGALSKEILILLDS